MYRLQGTMANLHRAVNCLLDLHERLIDTKHMLKGGSVFTKESGWYEVNLVVVPATDEALLSYEGGGFFQYVKSQIKKYNLTLIVDKYDDGVELSEQVVKDLQNERNET